MVVGEVEHLVPPDQERKPHQVEHGGCDPEQVVRVPGMGQSADVLEVLEVDAEQPHAAVEQVDQRHHLVSAVHVQVVQVSVSSQRHQHLQTHFQFVRAGPWVLQVVLADGAVSQVPHYEAQKEQVVVEVQGEVVD